MTDDAQCRRMPITCQPTAYTEAMAEVGSPVHSRITVEEIANAIAGRWRDEPNTAVEMLTSTAVYLQDRKLVEWVFATAESAAQNVETFSRIRKCGIDVGLVLPMSELGRAHEEFWGSGLILYGWIERGDDIVRFTGPEVA